VERNAKRDKSYREISRRGKGEKETCAAATELVNIPGILAAPIAQLDRASDYGSNNALFAIFIKGNQSAAFVTVSTA
jgi:hypothetical protein